MKKQTKKMKKVAAALTAAVLTAGAALPVMNNCAVNIPVITASAEDESYVDGSNDTFYYQKYSDHIAISGLKSEKNEIVIPETIDGLPVTKIQMYSFQYLSAKSITFPDSITEIDSYSFSDCKNITEITLPANIERLGFHVFENCTSLETVNFPDHPVKASDFTFDNTPWLTAQRQKNPLVIVNNSLIDARTVTGDVKVPSGVKYVAGGAFSKNDKVTSVVLPTSVTEIADSTFWMCSNLKSVDAKGAEVLGTTAFGYCTNLRELKLSSKLKCIKEYCFTECTGSGTITFYGSEGEWNNVEKLDAEGYLQRAKIVFDKTPVIDKVIGDINSDGSLDAADAVLLSKWLLGIPDTTLENWKSGDLDQDGQLTCDDLVIMRKEITGR